MLLVAAMAAAGQAMIGCGGKPAAPGEAETTAEESGALKRRSADSLPPVAEYLPPQDNGRVELAPPQGWRVLPRLTGYLANFTAGKTNNDLPRIRVTVGDPPAGAPAELTEENAGELTGAIAKSLAAAKKSSLIEPPKALVLGDRVWSRYVRNPRSEGDPLAIQTLQTVYDGRLYTVEILVNANSPDDYAEALLKHRDSAYSVAAHMKFAPEGSGGFQFKMPPMSDAKPPKAAK
jgi:hypothetical protein